MQKVKDAFRFSDEAHLGQFRRSGAPYITHPLAVAEILTDWRLDGAAIQAALLHDVLEDSGVAKEKLVERFGAVVADLVDGVSKLDKLQFSSTEQAQAENFRKMLLAMARDVRVMLIKLADRLHNMRTLDAVDPQKRRRIARETLEIYAPIAHRLGLNTLFRELEELSFEHLHPDALPRAAEGGAGARAATAANCSARSCSRCARRWRTRRSAPRCTAARRRCTASIARWPRRTCRSRRCSTSTASASWSTRGPSATSRSARCTRSSSRCRASSRTTSRSRRSTATSRCTPR